MYVRGVSEFCTLAHYHNFSIFNNFFSCVTYLFCFCVKTENNWYKPHDKISFFFYSRTCRVRKREVRPLINFTLTDSPPLLLIIQPTLFHSQTTGSLHTNRNTFATRTGLTVCVCVFRKASQNSALFQLTISPYYIFSFYRNLIKLYFTGDHLP